MAYFLEIKNIKKQLFPLANLRSLLFLSLSNTLIAFLMFSLYNYFSFG